MVPRGPWTIAEGEFSFGLEYGTDFEYVGMPWYGDNPSFAAETGWSIAVNGNTKEQEAAMKFVEFFSQEDILLDFNVACAQIPADKNVATDPAFVEKMEFAAPLVDILDYGHFIGYFNTDVYKEEINDMFVKLNSGTYANVDEALAALEKSLNDKINK
jgi:multiple sugar transport system substrate-binding protein